MMIGAWPFPYGLQEVLGGRGYAEFFHWRASSSSTVFTRKADCMNDPTTLTLSGALALALSVMTISVLVCYIRESRSLVETPETTLDSELVMPGTPLPGNGRVPTWFYRPMDLVGVGFVFLVFSGLIISSLGATGPAPKMTPGLLIVNIGFQFVLAGIIAVPMSLRVGLSVWLGLRWREWPRILLVAPVTVLSMWILFGGLQVSGYLDWMESLGVETVQDSVKLLQTAEDPWVLGLMAVAAVIAAPLCEELVFRGYFYPVLKRMAGTWSAAFCSALVFAAAHGSLTALLPLFIFGLALVLVYEKTGSIWAPVAVHFCFNGATVLAQLAARTFQLEVPI